MKSKIEEKVNLKNGITVTEIKGMITVKGPKGEITKNMYFPGIVFEIASNQVKIKCETATNREKVMIGTFTAHLENMVKGVQEPFVYKLKICSGHFPMTALVQGQEIILKNFIGEAKPRKIKVKAGAKVEVQGAEITVSSPDKEVAGQMAADLEKMTRRTKFDNRIFQDGIYIVSKSGKMM